MHISLSISHPHKSNKGKNVRHVPTHSVNRRRPRLSKRNPRNCDPSQRPNTSFLSLAVTPTPLTTKQNILPSHTQEYILTSPNSGKPLGHTRSLISYQKTNIQSKETSTTFTRMLAGVRIPLTSKNLQTSFKYHVVSDFYEEAGVGQSAAKR